MISKISRGTDLPALVSYLFGPGRHNEHEMPRLVASASVLEDFPLGVTLTRDQVLALGREMDAMRIRHGIPALGALRPQKVGYGAGPGTRQQAGTDPGPGRGHGHVWQMSLSLPVGDRELTDEQWGAIAREAMDRLGFTEASGKEPVRWIAVRHGTSRSGNEHIHIAATIVRDDGTKASLSFEKRKMSAFAAEMEQKYGLVVVDGRATRGAPGLSRAEIERAAREGRGEADRTTLARVVREARTASKGEGEFVRRLSAAGVRVRPRYGAGEGAETVTGYSVSLRSKVGEPLWFGGNRLGPDLSLPKLREFWESSPEEIRASSEAWRQPARLGRVGNAVASDEWRRASKVLDAAYDKLQALPVSSPEWAGVAREVSGLYAAWSRRLEGDRPGPLARAADLLAEAGQVPPGQAPVRAGRGEYRGATMVVAQGHIGPAERGTGWAMLLVALHRHLAMVAKVEEARGRLRLATKLHETARRLEDAHGTAGGRPAEPRDLLPARRRDRPRAPGTEPGIGPDQRAPGR
jgi:hypothetical protein